MRRAPAFLLLALLLLGACARPPGRGLVVDRGLSEEQTLRARQRFEELLQARRAERWTEVRTLGLDFLERYPGFEDEAAVFSMTAHAARSLGDDALADRLLKRLLRLHPEAPASIEARVALAEAARERGRWVEEAQWWVQAYPGLAADDPRRDAIRQRLRVLLEEELDTSELVDLADSHPRSVIGSTAAWLAARRLHDEGAPATLVGPRLEAFLREYPESRYVDDVRALLALLVEEEGYQAPVEAGVALGNRIGLLCPLSGEYAALGQAMYDGALLAIEEHNRATGDDLRLIVLDTRGDEVEAVRAARRLIEQEEVIAVVGALLSSTTVAVAVLCEERGVPLVSPTATKETISELGAYVFQTNSTKSFETSLLARAAVQALQRRRFGLLYPEGEEGAALARRFGEDVRRLGGEVVVQRSFDRSATDFGGLVRELRGFAPEAIFIPANPTEVRLIAPQLVFHDLRVQLLGLSSWNNSLLLREAGSALDRAVFPSDVALIPEEQRERFEELWSRRFRQRASNPFGLKSYFGLRRIIEGLDPQGGNTRDRLRASLEAGLLGQSGGIAVAGGLERLRIVHDGQIEAFPVALFPSLARVGVPLDRAEPFPGPLEEVPAQTPGSGASPGGGY